MSFITVRLPPYAMRSIGTKDASELVLRGNSRGLASGGAAVVMAVVASLLVSWQMAGGAVCIALLASGLGLYAVLRLSSRLVVAFSHEGEVVVTKASLFGKRMWRVATQDVEFQIVPISVLKPGGWGSTWRGWAVVLVAEKVPPLALCTTESLEACCDFSRRMLPVDVGLRVRQVDERVFAVMPIV
ncbi:hypothetical protein LBMAG48_13150 [Phycisphaerae bacterium]|nr:hypothetical protein LBMAG48_13150 [Phycisphaerae bacterium]